VRAIHEGTRLGKLLEGSTEQQSGVVRDINILTGPVEQSFRFAAACRPSEQDF